MVKVSATFLLLLVALGPLASAHGAKKPQPLEASDNSAAARGATPPAEAVEVLKPADAAVTEIAVADKAAEEMPGAMPTGSLPASEAAEVPTPADAVVPSPSSLLPRPLPSAVRALRGTALPVATGSAIPAANAVAAKALSPPVDASLASPGSMLKTIGLALSSILQQGATVAMAPTPQAAVGASQRVIAPNPLQALEAFCGRWIADKEQRNYESSTLRYSAIAPYEAQYWLEDGVLWQISSMASSGKPLAIRLDEELMVRNGEGIRVPRIRRHRVADGHLWTTLKDENNEEPENVMSLHTDPRERIATERWVDSDDKLNDKLHQVIWYFSPYIHPSGHPISVTFERDRCTPKTCSKPLLVGRVATIKGLVSRTDLKNVLVVLGEQSKVTCAWTCHFKGGERMKRIFPENLVPIAEDGQKSARLCYESLTILEHF